MSRSPLAASQSSWAHSYRCYNRARQMGFFSPAAEAGDCTGAPPVGQRAEGALAPSPFYPRGRANHVISKHIPLLSAGKNIAKDLACLRSSALPQVCTDFLVPLKAFVLILRSKQQPDNCDPVHQLLSSNTLGKSLLWVTLFCAIWNII